MSLDFKQKQYETTLNRLISIKNIREILIFLFSCLFMFLKGINIFSFCMFSLTVNMICIYQYLSEKAMSRRLDHLYEHYSKPQCENLKCPELTCNFKVEKNLAKVLSNGYLLTFLIGIISLLFNFKIY